MRAKTPRYHANKGLTTSDNPHEAIIMPSEELEVDNEQFFESVKALFSVEQIEDFKRVRSYVQFREYCLANDMMVLF